MADKIRKMDDNTFNELFREGELDLIMLDGGENLTPQQLKKVKEYGRIQYELKLQEMGAKVASQPGYKEFMMMPLISSIMKQSFAGQSKESTQQVPTAPTVSPPKAKKISKKKNKKNDPNHSTLGKAPIQNLRIGDSEADLLARMFTLQKEEDAFYKKQEKIDAKYRKRVDKDKDRRLEEVISALSGKKPSKIKGVIRKASDSGLLKYGLIGAAAVGGLLASRKAFANVNLDTIFNNYPKFEGSTEIQKSSSVLDTNMNMGDLNLPKTEYTQDTTGAKKSIEDYYGKNITDAEFDELIRLTHSEAGPKNNPEEQAKIMATVLNRARQSGKSIHETIMAPGQFEPASGTFNKKTKTWSGPNKAFTQGPTGPTAEKRKESIISSVTTLLPYVSRKQTQFTAANPKAYEEPGHNIGYLYDLKAQGGEISGGTIFNTPRLGVSETKLTSTGDVIAIGDSLAVGVNGALGVKDANKLSKVGDSPSAVLKKIQDIEKENPGYFKGKKVVLGSGAPNTGGNLDSTQVDLINQQITLLKSLGAIPVLLGTGPGAPEKGVHTEGMNDKLKALASSQGIPFLNIANMFDIKKMDPAMGLHLSPDAYKKVSEMIKSGNINLAALQNEVPDLKLASNSPTKNRGGVNNTVITTVVQGSTTVALNNNPYESNRPIMYDVQYGSVT
jgi:hypothetical protein